MITDDYVLGVMALMINALTNGNMLGYQPQFEYSPPDYAWISPCSPTSLVEMDVVKSPTSPYLFHPDWYDRDNWAFNHACGSYIDCKYLGATPLPYRVKKTFDVSKWGDHFANDQEVEDAAFKRVTKNIKATIDRKNRPSSK